MKAIGSTMRFMEFQSSLESLREAGLQEEYQLHARL